MKKIVKRIAGITAVSAVITSVTAVFAFAANGL